MVKQKVQFAPRRRRDVPNIGLTSHFDPIATAKPKSALARKPKARRFYHAYGKRLFDLVLFLLVAPFAIPVFALLVAIIGISGGKPIYRQARVGREGKVFQCVKIRTMVRDADRVLNDVLTRDPDLAAEWAANQKLANDPRITRFGHFLRRTSLDELPQLWNVLKGEMSFIGPRPFTERQKAAYDSFASTRAYYTHTPGISGLWQVSCRNDGDFAQRVQYDETYLSDVSFPKDLLVAFRTAWVVLRATGK